MPTLDALASRLKALEDQATGSPRQPLIEAIVAPGETPATVTDRICELALRSHTPLWWWGSFAVAFGLFGLGAVSVAWLFANGVAVFGNDWPVMWGFPILLYVWWIGIASGGTFVSALFFLTRSEWRTSTNRIAETMMVCAIASAGVYPILHLGRPWFAYWLFPYANTMGLWPQWRSPLVWDFYALFTYVCASLMFWYLGLIPDLASVRDRAPTRRRQVVYGVLALGFRGDSDQWRHFRATYGVMAAIMAPVVVSIHSIVGLDFAGGQSPGWHSTQFPPFFVFGALLSGLAMVLVLLIALRWLMRLGSYITARHLDVFGKLILASSIALGYSYLMDAFSTFYGPEEADRTMFVERVFGIYWPVYWGTILLNILIPQCLWFRRLRLSQPVLLIASFSAIIGMILERYEIVVTSLHRPRLPSAWGNFFGTFWDWSLFAGTIGLFLTLFLLAIRFLPVMSMAEMRKMLATGEQLVILARFRDLDAVKEAAERIRNEGCEHVRMFTPIQSSEEGPDAQASLVPLFMLLGGLIGGGGFFLLQTYADVWAYPMNIGGRPDFSWPPYVPNAFEVGVLAAMATGLVAFLIAAGLPRLYAPVDRFRMFREASRDGYFVLLETTDPARFRPVLESLNPLGIEEMA